MKTAVSPTRVKEWLIDRLKSLYPTGEGFEVQGYTTDTNVEFLVLTASFELLLKTAEELRLPKRLNGSASEKPFLVSQRHVCFTCV